MIALLLLANFGFSAQEIKIPDTPTTDWRYATIAGVTDRGLVGGYTIDRAGHGMSMFGSPFVWKEGRGYRLPLGKASYGHVAAVQDHRVAGDVSKDGKWKPAIWTPHPTKGWAAARLTLWAYPEGVAKEVDPKGRLWVTSELGFRVHPSRHETPAKKFDLAGVDARGRVYGTTYGALGIGFSREGQAAVRYANGKWERLGPDDRDSEITDVNRHGVAIGRVGETAGQWRGGEFRPFPMPGKKGGRVSDINDGGDVVGESYYPDPGVYLWRDGQVTDLSSFVRAVKILSAEAMNERGQVVVSGMEDGRTRLFLLTPS